MKQITVYTTNPCPFCTRAKQLLSNKGYEYSEIELGWDERDKWDELAARSGMKTMPQIFIGEECVGGFTELAKLDADGKLDALVNA